ncbi:spidroin-1-like [Panicum virgatum]|uniref:spidroin-1-like n=1 Tax=Panicum virgatum TaxID=38727 RepID=UPI0019D6634D|nr:spidroin-1-like [Panicum virgatum]
MGKGRGAGGEREQARAPTAGCRRERSQMPRHWRGARGRARAPAAGEGRGTGGERDHGRALGRLAASASAGEGRGGCIAGGEREYGRRLRRPVARLTLVRAATTGGKCECGGHGTGGERDGKGDRAPLGGEGRGGR